MALWFALSGLLGTLHGPTPSTGPVALASSREDRSSAAQEPLLPLSTPGPTPTPWASPTPDPTPTPEPTPEPTPSPTPVPQSVMDRIRAEWRRQGLSNTEEAVHVASCETPRHRDGSPNPAGHNPSGKYHGTWQADMDFARSHGTGADPHTQSIEGQTRMAANGFKARGWQPWDPRCRP